MTISSTGVGSGLDVKSIVSQLVAIEKQPLVQLQTTASKIQTQLSLYGTVKSQISALGDAAALLSGASGWNAQKATSSNSAAVNVTVGSTASSTALTVSVQQLAQAQSTTSAGIAKGTAAGATGSLSIKLGTWSGASFTQGAAAGIDVTVDATDTVSTIASKINAANAGVTATVLSDGTNERLVVRSTSTGAAAGFNIAATGGNAALSTFAFTDSTVTTPSATGMFMGQSGLDAQLKINGVALTSATNNMTNVTPGVSLQLLQTTTASVDITVANDQDVVQKNIQSFVDAYNNLNKTLASATAYSAATKTGGPLQGDSTTLGLQNALRSMLGSSSTGSTFTRLSEIGLERQTDGSLKINQTKLTSAMQNQGNLKNLFTTDNSDPLTNGFGLKVRDFARAMVAFDGQVTNKSAALQSSITRNTKDQDRVTERAARVETQLLKQYSALDSQMATLTGLNSYVTAQLAQWNKSTS
ncbi:MAG: flagellar filament capping protein FliD [Pseudomonadota bacterium]